MAAATPWTSHFPKLVGLRPKPFSSKMVRASPSGPKGEGNAVIHVAPAWTSCANSIYAVFPRLFGDAADTSPEVGDAAEMLLTGSRVFRGGRRAVRCGMSFTNSIASSARCALATSCSYRPSRAPGRHAKKGPYGSPFAALDHHSIDPELVEFDHKVPPLRQFDEFVDEVHVRGGAAIPRYPNQSHRLGLVVTKTTMLNGSPGA